jgi:hypothetical protein
MGKLKPLQHAIGAASPDDAVKRSRQRRSIDLTCGKRRIDRPTRHNVSCAWRRFGKLTIY